LQKIEIDWEKQTGGKEWWKETKERKTELSNEINKQRKDTGYEKETTTKENLNLIEMSAVS
jgi:hypothetical protein